jgi:hypothetical protein
MALDLPPKNDSKDGEKSEVKPRATSSAALSARVAKLEKLVGAMADAQFGKNVRPTFADDETEESTE